MLVCMQKTFSFILISLLSQKKGELKGEEEIFDGFFARTFSTFTHL